MGEIFKPGERKKDKIKRIAEELQISEDKAEKILKERKFGE